MEGSGQPRFSDTRSHAILELIGQALPVVFGAAALAVLAAKLLLAWRINVNWDEFFFLSHVHALARGELQLLMQGAYTHLFRWVAALEMQEVDQVVWLRVLMWTLLVLSAWLVYRLARRFASPAGAAFALLSFIASWPVLKHGASFRADSMLLPLTLAVLLLVTRPGRQAVRNDVAAGLCLALAFTLTTKAVLLLPALVVMVFASGAGTPLDAARAGHAIRRMASILVTAGVVSELLIAAHATQIAAGGETAGVFAARTVGAALFDVPLMSRGSYFRSLLLEDPVYWAALLVGLAIAVRSSAFVAAASVLALLPILFYRNAFPYYYPVMMAPTVILVALAADWLRHLRATARPRDAGLLALAMLGLLLMHDAWDGVMTLRFDEQQKQRQVVAAVHEIFPSAVPYIDHSGMVASFPKANFLMSGWGIESYLARGEDFMPSIIAAHKPPLLLANHDSLTPGTRKFRALRESDQLLIRDSYVDYWGPIRVAGTERLVPPGGVVLVRLPFAGLYRVESDVAILIAGQRYDTGDRMEWHADTLELPMQTFVPNFAPIRVRLVWAAAQEPPKAEPPATFHYSRL
jgi:hypothetical protein